MGSIRNRRGGYKSAPPGVYYPFLDPADGDSEWEDQIVQDGQVLSIMFCIALGLGLLLYAAEYLGIPLPKPD